MKSMAIVALFVFAAIAIPVHALDTPALDVVLSSQNPYPVRPGQTVDLGVSLQNAFYWKATNIVVEIMPKEPFTLLPGQNSRYEFSSLDGLQSRTMSFKLAVSREAITSSYDIEFRVYVDSTTKYNSDKIQINVQGQADLVLESLETEPQTIEPGSQVHLKAALKNVGTGTAHDARLNLSTTSEIVPLLGGGSVYIGDIEPSQTRIAEMLVNVDSAAEEKTYPVTITADFIEENNTASAKKMSVGLPVRGKILIEVINVEAAYTRNVVKIEVANKGTADAKSLEAHLVVGNATVGVYYVSQLKATKKTTLEFPLVLNGQATLVMDYIGPGVDRGNATKDMVFSFVAPSSGDGTMNLVYIVIIAVAAFFVWRKFFRKKKK